MGLKGHDVRNGSAVKERENTTPIPSTEKAMASHSSTLAWKIHGQRGLEGYSPWGR